MNRVTVAGIALLHRPGTGPTLMLLHGIGSNATSWAPTIAKLPEAFDVIAWWAPGYGASEPVAPERPVPADYAARLRVLLDALGKDRVVLAGHSLGTLFAASFAASHPGRVAALALLSPALGYRVRPGEPLPPKVQARIDELAALGPERFAAQRAALLPRRPEVAEAARRAMAEVRLPGYAQAVYALGQGDQLADAARITGRVLVGCGEQDGVTPPDQARRLHAALPAGTALRLVPDCGHLLPQEAPDEAAAMLTELADG